MVGLLFDDLLVFPLLAESFSELSQGIGQFYRCNAVCSLLKQLSVVTRDVERLGYGGLGFSRHLGRSHFKF